MFSVFRNFTARNIPQKLNFGRFDIKTTEHQKMVKAILANSDNCGDTICGDPVEVKNIINNKHTDIDNSSFNKFHRLVTLNFVANFIILKSVMTVILINN